MYTNIQEHNLKASVVKGVKNNELKGITLVNILQNDMQNTFLNKIQDHIQIVHYIHTWKFDIILHHANLVYLHLNPYW